MKEYLTTGKFSKLIGVSMSLLPYWESNKVLIPHHKSYSGRRYYSVSQLKAFLSEDDIALGLQNLEKEKEEKLKTFKEKIKPENKLYTVYCHENKINGKKYFGVTSEGTVRRWRNGTNYDSNHHFNSAIKKYGWDSFYHIVLFENINYQMAEEIEKYLINKYKTYDYNYGYNVERGGFHNKFYPKILENSGHGLPVFQYDLSGKFIKKYENCKSASVEIYGTDFNHTNLLNARRGDIKTHIFDNFIWSPKDLGPYVKPYLMTGLRRVGRYDVMTGSLIEEYYSIYDAKHAFNDAGAHIRELLDNKSTKRTTAYGYKWRYLDPEEVTLI